MPPHKQVLQLKVLGRNKVLQIICEIIINDLILASDDEWQTIAVPLFSSRLQIVKDILINSLGANLMQEILNVILEKDEAVNPEVRYLALQLLLVKGVNYLAVGHFPESYYSFVLDAIADSAVDIERLDLKGLWVREADKLSFYKVLRRLNKIHHLILKYVCDDELLPIIGKNCPKLVRLDISGSGNITERGICNFIENPTHSLQGYRSDICASLQIFDLGGPGAQTLAPSLASKLISSIPHLKSLGSFERTSQALEILYKENPNVKFNLQYIHDLSTNSERMSIIAKTCPDLQAVYLDTPGGTAVQHLDMLRKMTEVKLHKVRWNDVLIMLQKCGTRLRNLMLLTVWGQIDFLILGSLCTELINLELYTVSLSCSDTSHHSAFKKMKKLSLIYSQVSTTCIKLILNQSISIQKLSLGDCAQLTDAAVITSLMDHSLKKVQSIWFGLAQELTMRTVYALIEHCPELTNLGNLAAWSVPSQEVALLRVQLLLTNTDLALHEYGPEEEEGEVMMVFI